MSVKTSEMNMSMRKIRMNMSKIYRVLFLRPIHSVFSVAQDCDCTSNGMHVTHVVYVHVLIEGK